MVSLSEFSVDTNSGTLSLKTLRDMAQQRMMLGLNHGVSGVVGPEEDSAFKAGSGGAVTGLRPQGDH
jgi:hypothetical protein